MSSSMSTDPAGGRDAAAGAAGPARPPAARAAVRVCVVTLGCPKNAVDSEEMLAALEARGFRLAFEPEAADAVVVNTCAFIEDAERESVEEILALAALKESGSLRRLIVAGCLAERHGEALFREIPQVDGLVGPGSVTAVADVLAALLGGGRRLTRLGCFAGISAQPQRVRTGAPHTAYVKIAEGCDHRCAFCLIPRLRGPQRSRGPDSIAAELESLAGEGVREAVLIAQDTTAYGRDLPGRPTLAALLERLVSCDGPEWLRLMYTHPAHWDPALDDLLAAGGRLLPYVDLPIQHVADAVLRAMQRGHDGRHVRRLVERLRRRIPGLVLRTTVMTGHPGEGPREFHELLQFLEEFPFDRLGAFAYSPQVDSPDLATIPAASRTEAEERRGQVLELQSKLAVRTQMTRKGRRLDVLIEGVWPDRDYAIGRSYGEAPEIDGVVHVKRAGVLAEPGVEPGEFLSVRVIGAGPYDLVGVPVGSPAPGAP
jgi:ribosomal protein S12 methylthiotransferase